MNYAIFRPSLFFVLIVNTVRKRFGDAELWDFLLSTFGNMWIALHALLAILAACFAVIAHFVAPSSSTRESEGESVRE